jgi:hypothetical protein
MKDPERWKRAEQLYHAALEQKEDERQDFLLSACGGDDELRREVESLLGYEGQAAGFMEEPAFEMAGPLAPKDLEVSVARLAAGVRVGSYEILSLVDAGGMGEVYRARDGRLGGRQPSTRAAGVDGGEPFRRPVLPRWSLGGVRVRRDREDRGGGGAASRFRSSPAGVHGGGDGPALEERWP